MSGRRVKVTGGRFHPVIPDGSVWIGREAPYRKRSPYANPYTIAEHGREGALTLYRQYLVARPDLVEQACRELAGRDVACVCGPDEACHGDVLLELMAARSAASVPRFGEGYDRCVCGHMRHWHWDGDDGYCRWLSPNDEADEQFGCGCETFAIDERSAW